MIESKQYDYLKSEFPLYSIKKSVTSKKAPLQCRCCGNKELESIITSCNKLWKCPRCQFVFSSKNQEEIISSFLTSLSLEKTTASAETGWATTLEFLSPALAWMPDVPLKILDFGCGESSIPDKLRREGHRVIAVDIIPPAKSHPDRLTGDIMELEFTPGSFDLIYCYKVFEYLTEPLMHMKRLFHLLKADGNILIHTDMETPERKNNEDVENLQWNVAPCAFYRHKTFETMVEDLGHSVIYKNRKVILARKS